ncbi:protease modulator HflK [Fimbriiglobus ruber]|uniref:HflK protein n=1 Tax=Fimbriiglobus ruber TaxID=1908690 RepID=A0A225D828_9BACT|nr:protease modulator HflK [Fimbriiglobus ruber]OWK37711.1 HflK protein [Fimbriiglobus ruber]
MPRYVYVLLAALAAYLATGVTQVGPDERAVVRRFGRVVARPGPGLWVGLPWEIDRVDRVQVRTVRQLEVGYSLDAIEDMPSTPPGRLLTGDQNLVDVRLVLEYAIDDRDGELENYLAHRDQTDAVLTREVEAAAGEWVGGREVDEVLLTGRAALALWVMDRVPARIDAQRLGVVVQRVSVDHLAAPPEVRDAFEAVNQAQTAIRTRENQAEQEASQRLREAEAVKFRLEQQATAYRTERLAYARADAESFLKRLEQYRRLEPSNPDLLTALWWDEMGRTLLGMKDRGRVDLLDQYIGPNGLDVTQFLPPKKKQ